MDSLFREVRRRSGFGGKAHLAPFANQLGIAQERLVQLEGAAALATPEELDRLAMLVGVEVDQLCIQAVARSPVTRLLLKTQREHGGLVLRTRNSRRVRSTQLTRFRGLAGPSRTIALHPAVRQLADAQPTADFGVGVLALRAMEPSGAIAALGEFVRVVGLLADLEPWRRAKTDELLRRIDRQAIVSRDRAPYGAERAAADFRRAIGLGPEEGIASMRGVLAELGVATFWTDPGLLDPSVDGASSALPVAAVLVNLLGGGGCWWRTRMTLAHEIGHLLLDHQTGDGGIALVSP